MGLNADEDDLERFAIGAVGVELGLQARDHHAEGGFVDGWERGRGKEGGELGAGRAEAGGVLGGGVGGDGEDLCWEKVRKRWRGERGNRHGEGSWRRDGLWVAVRCRDREGYVLVRLIHGESFR